MSDEKYQDDNAGRSWIQRIAEQSWEPELLISGVAIFATLKMPDLFLKAFRYYQYNLQAGDGFTDEGLTFTIFVSITTAVQLLSYGFILHFAIRAFWVGLIGLNSVFTKGIQYDKLDYSEFYKKEMRKRLGKSEDFIIATDRLASVIFSVAFSIVLFLFGVSVIYMVFFLFMNLTKVILSPDVFEIYSRIVYGLATAFFLFIAVASLVLNLKSLRNKKRVAKAHFALNWYMGKLILPFIFKPSQHLLLTFMSNIPMKKYYKFLIGFFVVFIIMMTKSSVVNVAGDIETRSFYATRATVNTMDQNHYGDTFTGDLASDPLMNKRTYKKGELMEVFIPYPKLLDLKLRTFCKEEDPEEEDLERFQIRELHNEQRITCADQFFTLTIDESDTLNPDLFFSTFPETGQKGYSALLLLSDSISTGKHEFALTRKSVSDEETERREKGRMLSHEVTIPFWIE